MWTANTIIYQYQNWQLMSTTKFSYKWNENISCVIITSCLKIFKLTIYTKKLHIRLIYIKACSFCNNMHIHNLDMTKDTSTLKQRLTISDRALTICICRWATMPLSGIDQPRPSVPNNKYFCNVWTCKNRAGGNEAMLVSSALWRWMKEGRVTDYFSLAGTSTLTYPQCSHVPSGP